MPSFLQMQQPGMYSNGANMGVGYNGMVGGGQMMPGQAPVMMMQGGQQQFAQPSGYAQPPQQVMAQQPMQPQMQQPPQMGMPMQQPQQYTQEAVPQYKATVSPPTGY